MSRAPPPDRSPTSALGTFLASHRERIVQHWEEKVQRQTKAARLAPPVLRDHVPQLLDRMAARLERGVDGSPDTSTKHALERLDRGFDLTEVIREYALVRATILEELQRQDARVPLDEFRILHRMLDEAVEVAAATHAQLRLRVLTQLDRLSEVAFSGQSVDEALDGLARVLLAEESVDSAAVLLRERGELRVRAAVGAELGVSAGDGLPMSTGFAAAVVAARQAREIDGDHLDARSEAPGRATAIYGAPLLLGEEVLGVALMASRTAPSFSDEAKLLFRTMASRAALIVAHASLEARDRAELAVSRAFGRAGTLDEAVGRLMDEVGEAFGWDAAMFWKFDGDADVLRFAEAWSPPDHDVSAFERLSRAFVFRKGEGLPGRAWASGTAEWIGDVARDPNFPRAQLARQIGLRSAVGFAISAGPDLVGVVEFFSAQPRARADLGVLMTGAVSGHLEELVARSRAQDAIRASEAQMAAILDVSPDCIVSMDAAGRIIAWNPAAERTFGYARDEAVGRELAEVIIPERLRDTHRTALARHLSTGEGKIIGRRVDLPALRRDGQEFPAEVTITRVPMPGPPRFTGFIRDVTATRRAEQLQGLLAEVSGRLAETVAVGERLARSVDLLVPVLADGCVVDVVGSDGGLRRVAASHRDRATAQQLIATHPEPATTEPGPARVVATGVPERYEAGRARSLCVPLVARGRTLGALTLINDEPPRVFTEADERTAGDLGGRIGVAIDNAELYRAAERAADYLHAVVDRIPAAVLVADASGEVVLANQAAAAMLGGGLQGRRIEDAAWPLVWSEGSPVAAADVPLARSVRDGEVVLGAELRIRTGGDTPGVVLVNSAPVVDAEGTPVGGVMAMVDITERQAALEEVERAAAFREQLLGVVSHDLRDPLAAILMASRLLLRRGTLQDNDRVVVERVVSSAERLNRMISDILDYTRGRLGGGIPIAPRRARLDEIVRQVVEEVAVAGGDHEIVVSVHGDSCGEWDPDRIGQVVSNLLGNAVRYGASGSRIDVSVEGGEDTVSLAVHNRGDPIAEDLLPMLFEPFQRSGTARSRGGSTGAGLGLGLYIVHEVVKAHGGRVDVTSSAEQGTRFVVTLPRRQVARR